MYSREAGLSELWYAYPVYVSDAVVIELEQTTQNGRLDVLETAPADMRALHKYVGFSMDDRVAANVRFWPIADAHRFGNLRGSILVAFLDSLNDDS